MFSNGWLRARIIKELKPFNLTPEQYNVLRILKGQQNNAVCQREITCRMIDRNSNTTRILEKLSAKELVVRNQSDFDRRELSIRITEKGLHILEQIGSAFEINGMHKSNLTEIEALELNRLLDKIREE